MSGISIPAIGFGSAPLTGRACAFAVEQALDCGYRLIDTAAKYNNESDIGTAIRASGLPRESLFIITKAWVDDIDRETLTQALDSSLSSLKTEYVDLYCLHTPSITGVPIERTLSALSDLQNAKKLRFIGISNFSATQMERAVARANAARLPIVANQIECHPYLQQSRLSEHAKRLGLSIVAYCPLARGKVLKEPVLQEIAAEHDVSIPQVVLRWLIDLGDTIVIPHSGCREHMEANLNISGFSLSNSERSRIAKLERGDRIVSLPWLQVD